MKSSLFILFIFIISCFSCRPNRSTQQGFVYIHEVIPDIVYDLRYYSMDNFMGKRVEGYKRPVAYLSVEAAHALSAAQNDLNQLGLGFKIFDAYRPQKAVDHFIRWAEDPGDTLTKPKYYPDIKKEDLFELGYISERSGHTRGSTVDLTIIKLESKKEMDMGSIWDFFGSVSHHETDLISDQQRMNRALLLNEPHPDEYFDFDVE